MTESILAQIAALKTAPIGALKQKWRDLFESEPPSYNRRFLEHRLAYRIQELTYGRLKPETVRRLRELAETFDGGKVDVRRRRADHDRPIAGTHRSPCSQTALAEGRVMTDARSSEDRQTVTLRVPIAIRTRGGRKLVLAPDGAEVTAAPVTRHVDNAMVKPVALAFRWRDRLESGEYATIREIANAEKINESYVGRVLRLTLLAPDLIEAILGGRQLSLQLDGLMRRFPVEWREQRPILTLG